MHLLLIIYAFMLFSIFNLSIFLFIKYCLKIQCSILIISLIILLLFPAFLAIINNAMMNSYVDKALYFFVFVCVCLAHISKLGIRMQFKSKTHHAESSHVQCAGYLLSAL